MTPLTSRATAITPRWPSTTSVRRLPAPAGTAEAEEKFEHAMALLGELGADDGTIDVLINLGRLKVETGRSTAAATHWAEALAVSQRLSDPGTANILSLLATLPATS